MAEHEAGPVANAAPAPLTPSERHLLAQTPGAKRAKRRMRFSLRTLVLLVLFIGACALVWQRGFASWVESQRISLEDVKSAYGKVFSSNLAWSSDGKHIAAFLEHRGLIGVDLESGKVLWSQDPLVMRGIKGIRYSNDNQQIELFTSEHLHVDYEKPKDPAEAICLVFEAASGVSLGRNQNPWPDLYHPLPEQEKFSEQTQVQITLRKDWGLEAPFSAHSLDMRFEAHLTDPYADFPIRAYVAPNEIHTGVGKYFYAHLSGRIDQTIGEETELYAARFAPDNRTLAVLTDRDLIIFIYRWPLEWWGQFCRPEIWLALVLFIGLVISWWRDRRIALQSRQIKETQLRT